MLWGSDGWNTIFNDYLSQCAYNFTNQYAKKQTLVKPRVLLQRNCFLVIQMCIEYICPILNEYTELGSLLYILYIVGTWECSKRTIMLLTWHGIIKIGNYRFRVHI